jgi:hypothetical protein
MMREACDKDKVDAWQNDFWTITQEELERLVALVRADEQKKWEDQTAVEIHEAVLEERKACAKLVYNSPPSDEYQSPLEAVYYAIEARGNT